jgi:hypothetical protein
MKTLVTLTASLFLATAALPAFAKEGSVWNNTHTIAELGKVAPANKAPIVEGRNANRDINTLVVDPGRGAKSGK